MVDDEWEGWDREKGERLRDEALASMQRTIDRREWKARAFEFAVSHAKRTGQVTSEDVRVRCPPHPDWDPRILGHIFRDKRWRRVGFTKTPRASAHRRPIAVWQWMGG